jgi:hypothetical protein
VFVIIRFVIGRSKCVHLVPTVIELGVVVGEVKIRNASCHRYKERSVGEQAPRHFGDDFGPEVIGVRQYDLSPVLEIASVAVQIFKSNVHRSALGLEDVSSVIVKELRVGLELLRKHNRVAVIGRYRRFEKRVMCVGMLRRHVNRHVRRDCNDPRVERSIVQYRQAEAIARIQPVPCVSALRNDVTGHK